MVKGLLDSLREPSLRTAALPPSTRFGTISVSVVRYSFAVGLLHPQLPAGLSRRFRTASVSVNRRGRIVKPKSIHDLPISRRSDSCSPEINSHTVSACIVMVYLLAGGTWQGNNILDSPSVIRDDEERDRPDSTTELLDCSCRLKGSTFWGGQPQADKKSLNVVVHSVDEEKFGAGLAARPQRVIRSSIVEN